MKSCRMEEVIRFGSSTLVDSGGKAMRTENEYPVSVSFRAKTLPSREERPRSAKIQPRERASLKG